MRRRRRWEDEPLQESERRAKPDLAQLDQGTRAGVLEELQRAGGNSAFQQVVAPQLQRDKAAAPEKPAASSAASSHATQLALSIDGTLVGGVQSLSGCGVRSEVVVRADKGGVAKKRISSVEYEPCTLQVGLEMGAPFFDWIRDSFSRNHARKNLTVHMLDSAGRATREIELRDTLLTKVALPGLAAADTSPTWLTVTMESEETRWTTGSGAKIDSKVRSDPITPSTVNLEVDGVSLVPELASVAPWAFEQKVVSEKVGESRISERHTASASVGSLGLTLVGSTTGSKSGAARLNAWLEEVAVKGNDDKRTAVLSVSSKGGRQLKLEFSGVMPFSHSAGVGGGKEKHQFELAVEGVRLKSP